MSAAQASSIHETLPSASAARRWFGSNESPAMRGPRLPRSWRASIRWGALRTASDDR